MTENLVPAVRTTPCRPRRPGGPMNDIDELDRLHAAAWRGPWTAETWEVECEARDECQTGDDCDGSHDCETIIAPEAYPDGQVVVQTSHTDGRIKAPGLEQFAAANTAAIVALHNAWPAISARLRAAEAEVARLRGALRAVIDEVATEDEAWGGSLEQRHRAALGEP